MGTDSAPCRDTILQVPEQRGGAGSSPHQTAGSTDARFQAIRHSDNNDKRHRTCRENSETAIQDRVARIATSGWKLSGVTTLQSGKPLTSTDTRNGTAYGTASRAQYARGRGNKDVLNRNGGTILDRIKSNTFLTPVARCLLPLQPLPTVQHSTVSRLPTTATAK